MPGLRRAVVVGIDKYEDSTKIPCLEGAVNDANEIYEGLNRFGGFEISERHFLTGQKAKCDAIRGAMGDLFWKMEPCEMAVFYFSGHGFQDRHGNGFIAPYDHRYDEPLVHGIRIQELKDLFLAAKNKEKTVLILDCCHSGIATDDTKDLSDATAPFYQSFAALDNDMSAKGSGKFILASSGSDQKSREIVARHEIQSETDKVHPHGLFTFHLLEGLNGQAADDNYRVTLRKLQKHVSVKMTPYGEHECTFWDSGSGQFDDTVIVTATRRREINEMNERVKSLLDAGGAVSLFSAIDWLKKSLQASPESQVAKTLKEKIDRKLEQNRPAITLWLIQNKIHYLLKFPQFRKLDNSASNLCFDRIAILQDEVFCALFDLFRVAVEGEDAAILDSDLQSLESNVQAPPVDPNFGKL